MNYILDTHYMAIVSREVTKETAYQSQHLMGILELPPDGAFNIWITVGYPSFELV